MGGRDRPRESVCVCVVGVPDPQLVVKEWKISKVLLDCVFRPRAQWTYGVTFNYLLGWQAPRPRALSPAALINCWHAAQHPINLSGYPALPGC